MPGADGKPSLCLMLLHGALHLLKCFVDPKQPMREADNHRVERGRSTMQMPSTNLHEKMTEPVSFRAVATRHSRRRLASRPPGEKPGESSSVSAERSPSLIRRLWQYQQERFPLHKHGVLVAAFSFAGMSLSAGLRNHLSMPDAAAFLVCLFTSLTTFLMLRIADEHKDKVEDALYRPYLPVPRGLVSLGELRSVFKICAVSQLIVNGLFCPPLLLLLCGIWSYLFLMSKEFFAGDWLRRHPVAYLLSHMLILPLIDGYITACDWLPAGSHLPLALIPFLMLSFFNGLVLELGRKIRSPGEEEVGVETYSLLWGQRRSLIVWSAAIVVAAIFATLTAAASGTLLVVSAAIVLLIVCARSVAVRVAKGETAQSAGRMETMSACWLLIIYLCLGLSPFLNVMG